MVGEIDENRCYRGVSRFVGRLEAMGEDAGAAVRRDPSVLAGPLETAIVRDNDK